MSRLTLIIAYDRTCMIIQSRAIFEDICTKSLMRECFLPIDE
jgi:hypothetical protein